MLTINVHNVGSDRPDGLSDYEYEVKINQNVIEKGTVKGHNRKDGWKCLIEMLITKSGLEFYLGEKHHNATQNF